MAYTVVGKQNDVLPTGGLAVLMHNRCLAEGVIVILLLLKNK